MISAQDLLTELLTLKNKGVDLSTCHLKIKSDVWVDTRKEIFTTELQDIEFSENEIRLYSDEV